MAIPTNSLQSGVQGPQDRNNAKLNAIERHLRKIKCCLLGSTDDECKKCNCEGLTGLSFDVDAFIEALSELLGDITLNVGQVCEKEYLCTPDCKTVKCRECYSPTTGEVLSTTHTFLDGSEYAGDINDLTPNCINCEPPKEECFIIPATPQQCPTVPTDQVPSDECFLISANTCK